jgi:hypothetical protein
MSLDLTIRCITLKSQLRTANLIGRPKRRDLMMKYWVNTDNNINISFRT